MSIIPKPDDPGLPGYAHDLEDRRQQELNEANATIARLEDVCSRQWHNLREAVARTAEAEDGRVAQDATIARLSAELATAAGRERDAMIKSGQRIIEGLKEAVLLPPDLVNFQAESNRIEGINVVRTAEVEALQALLSVGHIWTDELAAYVRVIQPDAKLRATSNIHGVRVGNHIAPPSGPQLMMDFCDLLDDVNAGEISPHEAHCRYETLHPFTDGNGRSGRALWLWMRKGNAPLGFLHQFYYDALSALRPNPAPPTT